MKLLLAEDERDISNAIVKVLTKNNYVVDAVYDGEEALDYLKYEEYDGVIMDIMMPKLDGISVVKEIRKMKNNVPIIMLTAKSEIDDRVLGLDAGADDYLTKPFSIKELLARIRAITRRKSTVVSTYDIGNVTLNPKTYELFTDKGECRLSSKEFQVMEMLMLNPNNPISTDSFMDKIWGYDSDAEVNVVWVYISALRKKLVSIEASISIVAVRGIGYRLELSHD